VSGLPSAKNPVGGDESHLQKARLKKKIVEKEGVLLAAHKQGGRPIINGLPADRLPPLSNDYQYSKVIKKGRIKKNPQRKGKTTILD